MKKHILFSLLLIMTISLVSSCKLGRTVTVKDTVKTVFATTADYYDFYHPAYGEGKLKDINGTIRRYKESPDLPIRIIPSTNKQDIGYFIIKPASDYEAATTTADASSPPAAGELVLRLSEFHESKMPQRGN